jgi:hypothetical protein
MLFLALTALLRASISEIPHETWSCRNQVEVWCTADGCAAARPEEFTPMHITADAAAGFSACAYTGCWEGKGPPLSKDGRLLWTADEAAFSTRPDGGMTADVTLLILEKDGVGFVRVAGLATPILCERTGPDLNGGGEEGR